MHIYSKCHILLIQLWNLNEKVIVHPEKPPISTSGVTKLLVLIWMLSILISLPFYFFSKVHQDRPKKCFEALDSDKWKPVRVTHAYLMLILQYLVPVVIVSVTYFKICVRIKYRMVNQRDKNVDRNTTVPISQANQQKRQIESRRQRKTNILLASLAIIFALSWLPLNTVNIVMDFRQNSFDQRKGRNDSLSSSFANNNGTRSDPGNFTDNNASSILSIQAICLLIVLCSACANPVLYGWLNENFKREFKLMFKTIFLMCKKKPGTIHDQVETVQLVTDLSKIEKLTIEKKETRNYIKEEINQNTSSCPLSQELETGQV